MGAWCCTKCVACRKTTITKGPRSNLHRHRADAVVPQQHGYITHTGRWVAARSHWPVCDLTCASHPLIVAVNHSTVHASPTAFAGVARPQACTSLRGLVALNPPGRYCTGGLHTIIKVVLAHRHSLGPRRPSYPDGFMLGHPAYISEGQGESSRSDMLDSTHVQVCYLSNSSHVCTHHIIMLNSHMATVAHSQAAPEPHFCADTKIIRSSGPSTVHVYASEHSCHLVAAVSVSRGYIFGVARPLHAPLLRQFPLPFTAI